jgi:hypothetical protein
MTVISSLTTSDAWRDLQARLAAQAAKSAGSSSAGTGSGTASASSAADQLTLSSDATQSQDDVASKTRAMLDKLLDGLGITSPLNADGRLAVDMSGFDRRQLFAMASDSSRNFTADEEKAAALELNRRFDSMMAAAVTAARGAGTVKSLYTKTLDYLAGAGPEEKQSATWQKQKAALESGLAQLADDPSTLPEDNPDDPVLAYLDRITGKGDKPRSTDDLVKDARAALDLKDNSKRRASEGPDLSDFAADTLSAIVLDQSGKFSPTETSAAKRELRQRTNQSLLAALKGASGTGDFASRVMDMYGTIGASERQAMGLSDRLYQTAMSSYRTAQKLDAIGQQLTKSQDDSTGALSALGFSKLGSA